MNHTSVFWLTMVLSATALLLDGFAIWLSIRSDRRMAKAIKDLHESHDELHNVIARIG